MDKIEVTVNTTNHTSIASSIAENKRHLIQILKIVGPYKSRYDNETVRSMCNCLNESGVRTGGQLEVLDLELADIMSEYSGGYITNHGDLWSSNSLHDCITLREIRFGKSLISLSGRDFSGCSSLSKIEVTNDNPVYRTINGILYQYAENRNRQNIMPFKQGEWLLIKVPASIQDSKTIKFDCINRIEDYAFEDTRILSLHMPPIPPSCGSYAFYKVDISKITLLVPKESFNSYWSHPVWGQFYIKSIIED